MKLIVGLALLVTACGTGASSPAPALTFQAGQAGAIDLPAGHYQVSWASGCAGLFLDLAPKAAPMIDIPSPAPSGSTDVTWPGGPGYVDRGWSCDYTVTVKPAASPSG